MADLTLRAPAKLNLILRVGPPGGDGYHPVQSLMVALDRPADTVRVGHADRRRVDCAEAPGPANLAWAALDAFERASGIASPLAVEIDKRIPARAGLGGGSSDAAAVLVAANAIHDRPLDDAMLERLAARIGSDVAFFVRGGTQWAHGRGELLAPSAPITNLHALVVDGGVELATGAVYDAYDARAPTGLPRPATAPPPGPVWRWAENDLWPAARDLAPRLVDLDEALRRSGARATLLCGSGGAMAGLFEDPDDADAAARALEPSYRCWRTSRPGERPEG